MQRCIRQVTYKFDSACCSVSVRAQLCVLVVCHITDHHCCAAVVSKAKLAPLSSESFTLTVGGTSITNNNMLPFLNNAVEVPTAQVCSIISTTSITYIAKCMLSLVVMHIW
jgi:hypothetical protein